MKDADGVDCIRLRIDEPVATGDVTTHSAKEAFEKVLAYCGASLYRDDVDARLVEEAKTGTTTYTGAISKTASAPEHRPYPTLLPSYNDLNARRCTCGSDHYQKNCRPCRSHDINRTCLHTFGHPRTH